MNSELYGEKHTGSEAISGHEGDRKERSCEDSAYHREQARMESQVSDMPEIKMDEKIRSHKLRQGIDRSTETKGVKDKRRQIYLKFTV